MSQFDFGTLDPFVESGVMLASDLNSWRDALLSMHRGAARPSYIVPGQMWINNSGGATNWIVNIYISPSIGDKQLYRLNTTTGVITSTGTAPAIGLHYAPASAGLTAGAATKILWDTVDFNTTGGSYSAGNWTCTQGGVWHVDINIAFIDNNSLPYQVRQNSALLQVGGANVRVANALQTGAAGTQSDIQLSIDISLTAGAVVSAGAFAQTSGLAMAGGTGSWFTAHKIA